jgi:uncharacterized protein
MKSTSLNSAAATALVALVALALPTVQPAMAASATPVMPAIADPATNVAIPGKFTWFDLATSSTSASEKFYGKVFGWKFVSLPGTTERYVLIQNEGRAIGGMFLSRDTAGAKVGARWLSFVSVGSNMDRVIAMMAAGGGKVLLPATAVPGRGTHAIVRDAQGAIIGLLNSSSGDRADAPVESGEFFWVDLYARDPVAAASAYKQLGYEVYSDEVSGDDRLVLAAKGYARAGIVKLPDAAREPGWLAYVQVDDVPATLARVRAAGGKVLREPDPAVLGGQFAVFADPQGGVLGVLHWPSSATAGVQP